MSEEERAVIEAAKAWHAARYDEPFDIEVVIATSDLLHWAVRILEIHETTT